MTSHSDGLDYPLFFLPLELWPDVGRSVTFCWGDSPVPGGDWTLVVQHASVAPYSVVGVAGTAGDDEPVPGPTITFPLAGDDVSAILHQEYVVYRNGQPQGGGPIRLADLQSVSGDTTATVVLQAPSVAQVSVFAVPSGRLDTNGSQPWTPDLRDTGSGEIVDFGDARPPHGRYTITNGWVLGTAWFYFGPGTSVVDGYMVKLPADVLTEPDSFKLITCGQVAVLKGNAINATEVANGLLSGGDYNSWFDIDAWPKNYAVLEHSDATPGKFSNSSPIDLGTEVGGYMRVDYSYPLDVSS